MIAIRTTAIGLNQQFMFASVVMASDLQPPRTNGDHRKGWRFMGHTNYDIALISSEVVNAIRDRFADRILWKIGLENIQRFAPPGASGVFERTNEFFFLRIYANSGQMRLLESAAKARNVTKLSIPLGIMAWTQAFAIATERIAFEL
jgi:hypothetical protein